LSGIEGLHISPKQWFASFINEEPTQSAGSVVLPVVGPVLLDPGDTILLLTDGILEAQSPDNDCFDIPRVLEAVRQKRNETACEIVKNLHHAVVEFVRTEEMNDDVTIIVIKVEPEEALSLSVANSSN
jgi:serine/threonine protein phosphatase PrpC